MYVGASVSELSQADCLSIYTTVPNNRCSSLYFVVFRTHHYLNVNDGE